MPLLILFVFLLSLLLPSPSSSQPSASSPSEVLRSHGLPAGLLPRDWVESFAIDAAGQFELRLRRPCTARFDTLLHYGASVSGTIGYGLITSLSGISAQELFLWFPVRQIRVDVPSSGLIYFDVGVISKQFSLSLFDTPPVCRPVDDPSSTDGMIREGERIAMMVAKSRSGKLRYELDRGNGDKAVL